ncbi:MAG: BMC domain-containing protein [Deltaproteobacteria bacterium]|nr:BMC domain-containing protein [Deltaproteobacteria bacterium]
MSLIRPNLKPSFLPLGGVEAFAGVEVQGIPRGMVTVDALVKKAAARVVLSTPVTPGKFLVLFDGSVAEVEESFSQAEVTAGDQLIDGFMLPYAHEQLEPAVFGVHPPGSDGAIGLVETATSCSGIRSADAALKAAKVDVLVLHLSVGIGGKCYYAFRGELFDVQASVEAAAGALDGCETLLGTEIIARPHPDFIAALGV